MGSSLRVFAGAWAGVVALGAVAAAAFAGGAPTIAGAPLIPVGQEQVNALTGIDYWRVKLRQGDRLTVTYGPQKNYSWAGVCVYRPTVTDQMVATRRCDTSARTTGYETLTLTARPAGTWTIAVRPYPACSTTGVKSSGCIGGDVGYRLTANVQHETRIGLRAVNLARVGERVPLHGVLQGARGRVLLEASWDGGNEWTTVGIQRVNAGGQFTAVFDRGSRGRCVCARPSQRRSRTRAALPRSRCGSRRHATRLKR